jgi:subtilisin family serine protease
MSGSTRRRFLARTGALAVGAATVSGRGAAASSRRGRFIVDTGGGDASVSALREAGLEIVHDISQVDLAAVRGPRSTVARVADDFSVDLPIPGAPRQTEDRADADSPIPETTYEGAGAVDETSAPAVLETGIEGAGSPADAPYYPLQWDKRAFDIPAVHEVTRGEGARVAILDSGVHADHPDLQGQVNLELSRNFTDDGLGVGKAYAGDHGTVCGGVVAANGSSLIGTAPAAELVDCRVFAAGSGGSYQSDYLEALAYAADVGCDVANLSLGPVIATPLQYALYRRPEHSRVVDYAARRGTVTVVAAGNDAIDLRRYGLRNFSPGPTSLVVSATGPLGYGWPIRDADEDGAVDVPSELEDPIDLQAPVYEPALYSNYGSGVVSVSAPGGNYESVAAANGTPGWTLDMLRVDSVSVSRDSSGEFVFDPGLKPSIGTSFASPQVAAAAALVRSLAPSLPPADVKGAIEETARTVDGRDPSPYHGAGFLDPLGAVRAVD